MCLFASHFGYDRGPSDRLLVTVYRAYGEILVLRAILSEIKQKYYSKRSCRSPPPPEGGELLRISSDGDDRRIFRDFWG